MNGTISVNRVSTGGEDYVAVAIRHDGQRVQVRLSLPAYAALMTGLSEVPCQVQVHGNKQVTTPTPGEGGEG